MSTSFLDVGASSCLWAVRAWWAESWGASEALLPDRQGACDLLTRPENTVASIARLLGVSRNTIYKYLPEIPAARALPATEATDQATPAATN